MSNPDYELEIKQRIEMLELQQKTSDTKLRLISLWVEKYFADCTDAADNALITISDILDDDAVIENQTTYEPDDVDETEIDVEGNTPWEIQSE